jgi:hypothetical protein
MFDKYIIVEDGFTNVVEQGQVTGFQLKARLPYYRGLGLSMIEDLRLTVDGEAVPRDAIRVTLHGNTYTLDELEREMDDRWEFGEVGTVTVRRPGGLAAGEHTVELAPFLRISYLPFILSGRDTKVLSLAA